MDFGKLSLAELEQADLRLPPDHAFTQQVLQTAAATAPRVYVGCPVWADKTWVGKLYPSNAKDRDFLRLYARQFNTIELNITHYRVPDQALINEWNSAVPEGFEFCPKFPQVISHDKALQDCQAVTEVFCEEILRLGSHLGTTFLQLAPFFGPRQVGVLEQYLRSIPPKLPLAVEFRHADWFAQERVWQQTLAMLNSYGVATVITDVAGRRDVVHQSLSVPTAVIRFVGNELHPTDYSRVDEWVQRLKVWFEQGLQTLYFFVHCGSNHYAPDLALYFIRQLNATCGLQIAEPRLLPQAIQTSLF